MKMARHYSSECVNFRFVIIGCMQNIRYCGCDLQGKVLDTAYCRLLLNYGTLKNVIGVKLTGQ
jgi:hypothetical protein